MRIICACHRLQTTLRNAADSFLQQYPSVASVIIACKALVRFVMKSRPASTLLEKLQTEMNEPIRKLIQEAGTRWNSLLQLLESIVSCRKSILSLLEMPTCPPKIKTLARHLVKDGIVDSLIKVLTPFRVATKKFEAEKVPTVHMVVPTIKWLKGNLCSIRESNNLGPIVTFVDHIMQNLDIQFQFTKQLSPVELMGFALDPTNMKRSETDSLRPLLESGFALLEEYYRSNETSLCFDAPSVPTTDPSTNLTTQVSSTEDGLLWEDDFLGDSMDIDSPSSSSIFAAEIALFRTEKINPTLKNGQELLDWWKNHASKYPVLTRIARRILAIPASEAASERLFSIMKYLLFDQRSTTDTSTVNKQGVIRAFLLQENARAADAKRALSRTTFTEERINSASC